MLTLLPQIVLIRINILGHVSRVYRETKVIKVSLVVMVLMVKPLIYTLSILMLRILLARAKLTILEEITSASIPTSLKLIAQIRLNTLGQKLRVNKVFKVFRVFREKRENRVSKVQQVLMEKPLISISNIPPTRTDIPCRKLPQLISALMLITLKQIVLIIPSIPGVDLRVHKEFRANKVLLVRMAKTV
jgi:hypothetical protein